MQEETSKTFRILNDRTVLQFNKPENSYLDCDTQSDEESVIDDCLSPENTSGRAMNDDEKKVEALTKSLKETDIGRTEKVINLLDEGLDHLSTITKEIPVWKILRAAARFGTTCEK